VAIHRKLGYCIIIVFSYDEFCDICDLLISNLDFQTQNYTAKLTLYTHK